MSQGNEHTWVEEIFTPSELRQHKEFEAYLQANPDIVADYEKNWYNLLDEMVSNIKHNPESQIGLDIARKFMLLVNGLYGMKYAHLRTKKFEKGFCEGKGLEGTGLTTEIVSWLAKAVSTYWNKRIYEVLSQVGKLSQSELLKLWRDALDDIYGGDQNRKNAVCDGILKDPKISTEAKKWLQSQQR